MSRLLILPCRAGLGREPVAAIGPGPYMRANAQRMAAGSGGAAGANRPLSHLYAACFQLRLIRIHNGIEPNGAPCFAGDAIEGRSEGPMNR